MRLMYLGLFALVIFAVYLMGNSLSKSQDQDVSLNGIPAEFFPAEKGKAVLIEFSDFQCPACRSYYPLVQKLITDFGNKLTVTYKYFPLRSIHKNADISAQAGEAARLQGKFDEMEGILFEKQADWEFSDDALSIFKGYATTIGMDVNKFVADVNSSQVIDKVNTDYDLGISLKVGGTPTFFLNGKKLTNPGSYDEFNKLIQQATEQ